VTSEQNTDTDRLIKRCASLIEENKVLAQRRKEALRSHLDERTINLKLRESMIRAGQLLGERFGSCPLDVFEWSHPNTCDRQCGKDGGIEKGGVCIGYGVDRKTATDQQIEVCWNLYLIEYGKKAYVKKMKG